jgi:hypothetical protein
MSGAIHPLPSYAFVAWCLVKHRGNFTSEFLNASTLEIYGFYVRQKKSRKFTDILSYLCLSFPHYWVSEEQFYKMKHSKLEVRNRLIGE